MKYDLVDEETEVQATSEIPSEMQEKSSHKSHKKKVVPVNHIA
jgi:hypothetical protein